MDNQQRIKQIIKDIEANTDEGYWDDILQKLLENKMKKEVVNDI